MHLVDHLITIQFNPALCWHNKTTYYAQSAMPAYVPVPSLDAYKGYITYMHVQWI